MRMLRSVMLVGIFALNAGCPGSCGVGTSGLQQFWPVGETYEVAPESTHATIDGTVTYTEEHVFVRYADEDGNVWEVEYDLEPYE